MQWLDLYFIAYEGIPDGLIRRTPAIDVDFWLPVEFSIISDVPVQLVVEADSDPEMKRAVAIIEHIAQPEVNYTYDLRAYRYIRGAFYIPETVSCLEIVARGAFS